MGRRERKKAATRAAIVEAATALFLERRFDDVTVREIADAADVSPTTVFAHFPHKEALVFHQEQQQHEQLATAVRDRAPGTSISAALRAHFRSELDSLQSGPDAAGGRRLLALIDETPALQGYASRMWLRREGVLADTIAAEFGLAAPSEEIRVYTRFVLQIQLLATTTPDPAATLDAGFAILGQGWDRYAQSADRGPAATG